MANKFGSKLLQEPRKQLSHSSEGLKWSEPTKWQGIDEDKKSCHKPDNSMEWLEQITGETITQRRTP